ncbi:MAG TPA: hypothetical protein VGI12_15030 [Vicinamibacterales bacterium]|jgi:hypothetical protein
MGIVPRAGVAALALCLVAASQGASVRTWIGREATIEAHLAGAGVVRLEDVGTGVTRPRRAFLDPPEPVASLTWKVVPPGYNRGHWESYKSEIAAYELDRLLELEMVPPAVEREIGGETGAAIMWVDGVKSVKQTGGRVPSEPIWGQAVRRMQMFDNFIGNPDRNAGNILIGRPGELILIDHSRAFVTADRLPFAFDRVDATLWERMSAVTREELAGRLGRWLDGRAIDAMLARRAAMAARVDKLIRKKGRAVVIVP